MFWNRLGIRYWYINTIFLLAVAHHVMIKNLQRPNGLDKVPCIKISNYKHSTSVSFLMHWKFSHYYHHSSWLDWLTRATGAICNGRQRAGGLYGQRHRCLHVITNLSTSERRGEFIITRVASYACSSVGQAAVGRFVIDHMTAGSVFSDQSALTVKGNAHYQDHSAYCMCIRMTVSLHTTMSTLYTVFHKTWLRISFNSLLLKKTSYIHKLGG